MVQILQATYQDGTLILKDKLSKALEGKTVQVIVLAEGADLPQKRSAFLEFIAQHAIKLPPDYTFDRDDLYER